MCTLTLKSAHCPMGKWLTCFSRLTHAQLRTLRSTTGCACHRDLAKFPSPPHGKMADMPKSTLIFHFGRYLVLIRDLYVPATPANFQFEEFADVLASTHACTTAANAPVDYSLYVLQRPEVFPSPPWETHVLLLSLFAGGRCPCPVWHGHDNVFLDLREYSYKCACLCSTFPIVQMGTWLTNPKSTLMTHLSIWIDIWFIRELYMPATPANFPSCKLPIAPMGDSCFAHCLQGGGVRVWTGTVTITSSSIYGNSAQNVHAHVCSKVSIAQMGDSRFARCLQGGGVAVFQGTVSIVNSQIYSNTAPYVRLMFKSSHSPNGMPCFCVLL
jgi:hypothetical protein